MAETKITLFGGLSVDPGTKSSGAPLTRKARALVAYLGLRSGVPQSREKLADLLWGSSAEEQARASLRQTLSSIRKVLGEDLVTDHDQVAVAASVDLDVARFMAFVEDGDLESLEQAVQLYRGDLLDGFSLKEEPFEAWLRAERDRLRSLVGEALTKLAADYEARVDYDHSLQTANRLLVLDPLREDAHRTLMRTYAAQGRQAEALKQFEICRDTLRRELDVAPSPETLSLADDIRGQRKLDPSMAAIPSDRRQSPSLPLPLLLPKGPSVAILQFENKSGDADQDYFADGLTESIITGLTRFRNLFVIAVKSALIAHDNGLDATSAAREFGVAHIVEGSVRKAGRRIRVTAQLVESATGRRLWAENYDRDLDDIFDIQDEITDLIVATVAGRMEDANRQKVERKTDPEMAAYDYVLRGRQCLNRYTMEADFEARTHFERALELDPDCATAYAGLAVSYSHESHSTWSRDYDASNAHLYEYAQKAVALDENDDLALYALAAAYYFKDQYDLAIAQIDKAIALNPNDYHNICSKGWFCTFAGNVEEGLAATVDSMRRNPYSPDGCRLVLGIGNYMVREYETALQAFAGISTPSHFKLGGLAACYGQLGRTEEAKTAANEFLKLAEIDLADWTAGDDDPWRTYWKLLFRFSNPAEFDHLMEGLRKAGLPA